MTGKALARRRMNPAESGIAVRVVCWVITLVLILPMIVVIGLALNKSRYLQFPPDAISFTSLETVFNSSEWRRAFQESIIVALFVAPLATSLGTIAALGIRRMRFARFAQTVMIMPMIVPLIVTALAIYPIFSDLGLIGTTAGLVVAHTLVALPFAFLTVWASLVGVDSRLEQAASSLGAGWTQVLRRVTLPLIAPAIVASLVVTLAVSFDEIVLSLFVSSPANRTVPVLLWSFLRENLSPEVAAASLFVVIINLAIMLGSVLLARWAVRRRVSGKKVLR